MRNGRACGTDRHDDPFVDEVLHETGLVTVGIFRADVGHPSFRDSGPAERPIFVFPRTSVVMQHEGGRPCVLASTPTSTGVRSSEADVDDGAVALESPSACLMPGG